MTPEGKIKALVKARLAGLGPDCYRFMPVQTGYGDVGLDFFGCYRGVFFAIETKKDAKSKMTPRQEATRDTIERAGGLVCLVYDAISADEMIAMLVLKADALNGQ